ncbi:hypothetical protein ACBY01_08120 [Sphingomonas sp. ac-8]
MFSLIALYFAYRNQTVGAHIAPIAAAPVANDAVPAVALAKAA